LPLKAPCYIALAGLKDFGRLVCALERTPPPAFSFVFSKENVLAVQTDIINRRPVIYFAKNEAANGSGQYLAYRITSGIEEVLLADSVGNPTFVYSPVLNVEKLPQRLARSARVDKRSGYTVIKLKDLASLAKVAAYKTIYDEPPLPLFMFKQQQGDRVVLGAPMSANDNETVSYFYYVALDGGEEPKEPFLRYSSMKAEKPVFSSRLDEHGYIYLKVIRLAAEHPLVKTYD
jgi:hypothetical protein